MGSIVINSRIIHALLAGLIALPAPFLFQSPALAEHEIKSLSSPIPVTVTTVQDNDRTGDGKTLEVTQGEPFEGVLNETLIYKNQSIPEGTLFKGHVSKVEQSKRLARAGYYQLQMDEAVFPSGEVYQFDAEKIGRQLEADAHDYHHKKGVTAQRIAMGSIPWLGITAAVAVPLNFATTLSRLAIYGITVGTRSTIATAIEAPHYKEYPNPAYVVGKGIARGTGLQVGYNIARVSENPSLTQGQPLKLYVDPQWLKSLLQANDDLQQLNSSIKD